MLYGTRKFNENINYPTREQFYKNSIKSLGIIEKIKDNKPIMFVGLDFYNFELESGKTSIALVGHTQDGNKIGVKITNVKYYVDLFPAKILHSSFDSEIMSKLYEFDRNNANINDVHAYLKTTNEFKKFVKRIKPYIEFNTDLTFKKTKLIYKKIINCGVSPKFLGYRIYFKKIKDVKENVENADIENALIADENIYVVSYKHSSIVNVIDYMCAKKDIKIGTWIMLENYKINTNLFSSCTKLPINLDVDIKNVKSITPEHYEMLGITEVDLAIYNSFYMSLDIETINIGKSEETDDKKDIISENNIIFNIGLVFAAEDTKTNKLYKINLVTDGSNKLKKYTDKIVNYKDTFNIVCNNEKEILLAFTEIVVSMKPDFITGYNNLNFDFPQIAQKLRVHNLFDNFAIRTSLKSIDTDSNYLDNFVNGKNTYRINNGGYTLWSSHKTTNNIVGNEGGYGAYKKNGVNIKFHNGKLPEFKVGNSELRIYHDYRFFGIIMIDVFLVSCKLFEKEPKKTMNTFLKKKGIPEKLDMEYYKIWVIYELSVKHNVNVIPHSESKLCPHGFDYDHDYEVKGNTYLCTDNKKYLIANDEIDKAIYDLLEGKSIIDLLNNIYEYCNYDAEAALRLLFIYGYMEEKRNYCEYVNLPLYKNIYMADKNKVENGMRKNIKSRGYLYIESKYNYIDDKEKKFNNTVKKYFEANPNLYKNHLNTKSTENKGGHVQIHVKGKILHNYNINGTDYAIPLPVEGFDFASLYPSILVVFNICCSSIILNKEHYKFIRKLYPEYRFIKVQARDLLNDNKFPNEKNKYFSDYYGVDFMNSTIYIVQHDDIPERMGLFPSYMNMFFNKRKSCKKVMNEADENANKILDSYLKDVEFMKQFPDEKTQKKLVENWLYKNNQEFRNHKITQGNYNMRQLAIKITMNSGYGTFDYDKSELYFPLIPMLVTYFGRMYVKYANQICIDHGLRVIYNDTDSTYAHHNPDKYLDIVTKFAEGKITENVLKRKLVSRSIRLSIYAGQLKGYYKKRIEDIKSILDGKYKDDMEFYCIDEYKVINNGNIDGFDFTVFKQKLVDTINKLNNVPDKQFVDILNGKFRERSFGGYLTQVREETLFPVLYCAPKKYFGLAHTNRFTAKYSNNDILVRGLKIRTRDCTEFMKRFINNLLMRIIDERKDVSEIIYEELDNVILKSVDYGNIGLYKEYTKFKRNKNNKIRGFIARIEDTRDLIDDPKLKALYRTPFELEVVNYVVTLPKTNFDIKGRKIEFKKCDLYEYVDVVQYKYEKHGKKNIDYFYYVKSLFRTAAQFLSYLTTFEFYSQDLKHKDYVELIDKKHLFPKYSEIYKSNNDQFKKLANKQSIYVEKLKLNKTIINSVVLYFLRDLDNTLYAYNFIMFCIKVKVSDSISKKMLDNIKNYENKFGDNVTFIPSIEYNKFYRLDKYNRKYNNEFLRVLCKDCDFLEKTFEAEKNNIDILHKYIVAILFRFTKKLLLDGVKLDLILSDDVLLRAHYYYELFIDYSFYTIFKKKVIMSSLVTDNFPTLSF